MYMKKTIMYYEKETGMKIGNRKISLFSMINSFFCFILGIATLFLTVFIFGLALIGCQQPNIRTPTQDSSDDDHTSTLHLLCNNLTGEISPDYKKELGIICPKDNCSGAYCLIVNDYYHDEPKFFVCPVCNREDTITRVDTSNINFICGNDKNYKFSLNIENWYICYKGCWSRFIDHGLVIPVQRMESSLLETKGASVRD